MPDAEVLAVGINSRGAVVGGAKYIKVVDNMEKKTNKASKGLSRFGSTAKAAFAAIGGALILRKSIITISSFENTMAELQGVTSATGEEMAQFTERARQLGATTRFSASQAAEGLLALSRAGFDVAESNAAIADTLNLATAAQLDLGRASEITSNTIRQFGLEAKEAGRVSDVMVNTANSANTNVGALAESLKFAGVTAGSFNISIEETTAALGAMADVGLRGGIAGRGLSMAMTKLVAPTEQAKKALYEMGVTMRSVNPEKVGIIDAFRTLRDAEMSSAQAAKIFGNAQLKSVLALTKSIDRMEELEKLNEKSAGTARRNAKLIESTLSGAYKELKSAIEEASLSAGDKGFLGVLKETVRFSTDVVRVLTGVEAGTKSVFRSAQIQANRFIKFWKIGFTEIVGGWKLIGVVAKHVAMLTGNFFIGSVNTVLEGTRMMISGIMTGMEKVLTAMEKPASFVDKEFAQAIQGASSSVRNFRNEANEAFNGLKMDVPEVGNLGDKMKASFDKTNEEIEKIKRNHIAVHAELVKQNLELKKQKRLQDQVNKSADIFKTIKETTSTAMSATTGFFAGLAERTTMITQQAIDGMNKLQQKTDDLDGSSKKFGITMKDVGSAISGTLTDAVLGARSLQSTLNDITNQLIQMAVQRAIMASFSGGGGAAPAAAKGMVAMANGGVVNGPTPALIGEAGPEAVIPLKRGEDGTLGLASGERTINETNLNIFSPDTRGVIDIMLNNPKVVEQMNQTWKQGYSID